MVQLSAQRLENRFKVDQLKNILKQCRDKHHYRIRITQNKKGLAEELHSIFSGAASPQFNFDPFIAHNHTPSTILPPHATSSTAVHSVVAPHSAHMVAQHTTHSQPYVPYLPVQSSSASSASYTHTTYSSTVPQKSSLPSTMSCNFKDGYRRSSCGGSSGSSGSSGSNGSSGSSHSVAVTQQQQTLPSTTVPPVPVPPHAPAATLGVVPGSSANSSCYQGIRDELLLWGFSSSQITAAITKRLLNNSAITQDLLAADLLGGPVVPALSAAEVAAEEVCGAFISYQQGLI